MKSLIAFLAMIIFAIPIYAKHPMNEMPMYGGQHDPRVTENKELSRNAAKLGWKYYYDGDHKTAIKRFNQCWMFNRRNPEAFWGFGLIMGARAMQGDVENNLMESIKFLKKALEFLPDNSKLMVDIAYSESLLGAFLKDKNKKEFQIHFRKSRDWYKKSEKINPTYPLLYSNWSILEFYEENYEEAKNKLATAKKLGFEPEPAYENDLESKLKK